MRNAVAVASTLRGAAEMGEFKSSRKNGRSFRRLYENVKKLKKDEISELKIRRKRGPETAWKIIGCPDIRIEKKEGRC